MIWFHGQAFAFFSFGNQIEILHTKKSASKRPFKKVVQFAGLFLSAVSCIDKTLMGS